MTRRVFRLHSTLELPLETVIEYFESDPELPGDVEDIEIVRRNNTLIIKAVAKEGTVSKYTPTAQLKASVTEVRVYEEEPEARAGGPPAWTHPDEEEEEIQSELVEFAAFKGDRETVLQNTALQYPMFEVLCDIARMAEKGTLTAISEVEGELQATKIVDGEERPASIEIVDGPGANEAASGAVNWRDNKFISG